MKIENILYKVNENRNSRDYFFCALCALGFIDQVTLEDIRKYGENVYSVQDRKLDIAYWWFAGLKDILSLSEKIDSEFNSSRYNSRLDIDNYCKVLSNREDFLTLVDLANRDRETVTSISADRDYYLFDIDSYEQCFSQISEEELNSKLSEIKRLYTQIKHDNESNGLGIWSAVLDCYPIQRILGFKIVEARRSAPFQSNDDFKYVLSKSLEYLKTHGVGYLQDNLFSFLSIFSNIISTEIRQKVNVKESLHDVVMSKVTDVTFTDRSTGAVNTLDSLDSINSEMIEHFSDRQASYKSFKMPDLNKSLSRISEFNGSLSNLTKHSVNMLSLLGSEPSCSELLTKLSKYSRKLYPGSKLEVVESKVYGTEQKSTDTAQLSGVVSSLYNSFRNIHSENILYVSHLYNKLQAMKGSSEQATNASNGLIDVANIYSGHDSLFSKFVESLNLLRDLIAEEAGIKTPRCTTLANRYYIYLYDRNALYYDRASLPLFRATSDSELYVPVPYEKDNTHNSIRFNQMVSSSFQSFDELKVYSEQTGKPLSDMYYYARNVDGSLKHVHEKTGGLLNLQNGENEFADIEKVYSPGELIKKSSGIKKFQMRSLILAEAMKDDEIQLDVLIDKISSSKEEIYDELSECSDGNRNNIIVLINNSQIREDSLISFTDIFCDRSNRLSAFMQGIGWRYGAPYQNVKMENLFDKLQSDKFVIDSGFVRPEYFDGVFMRYNGDNPARKALDNPVLYYMNFSNMQKLQDRASSDQPNTDLARLINFSYMKCDDFLGVEDIMFKFVLPSIIDLKEGEIVTSLNLGTTYKSKNFRVTIDKYVKIGAKLAWLALYNKRKGESKTYDLLFLIDTLDLDSLIDNNLAKSVGYDCNKIEAYQLIRYKLKQLALLLAKNCIYCTDLADLCKVFRDLVCGMLRKSDKVVTGKRNKDFKDILELIEIPSGNLYDLINSSYKEDLFITFLRNSATSAMVANKIKDSDLADKVKECRVSEIKGDDLNVVWNAYCELFDDLFKSEDNSVQSKLNFLNSMGYNIQSFGKAIFYDNVISELVNKLISGFEEISGIKEKDKYELLNIDASESTEVAVEQDGGLSRFYACAYVCNVLNKVYSFICDTAHDCYQLSLVTAVNNSSDHNKFTMDRCCFYLAYRHSMIEKLFDIYKKIKIEVSQPRNVFSQDDLIELHNALLLPESTNKIYDLVDSNEVIRYFSYVMGKSKNGVNEFSEYIRKVFTSNVNRVKRIAYPLYGSNSGTGFQLTSELEAKIKRLVREVNIVGKFKDTSLTLLKSSVKDSGLYRSLRFKDGLATNMDGSLFTLFSFRPGSNQTLDNDIPYVFLLHEDGLFFQVSIDGKEVKPVDTVESVLLSSGSEYLKSTTHSMDITSNGGGKEVFDSVSSRGVGIIDNSSKASKAKEAISDFLIEMSSTISNAVKLDIIEPKTTAKSLIEMKPVTSDRNELRVMETQETGLTVSNGNSLTSEVRQSVNAFKDVFSVLTSKSEQDNVDAGLIIQDMLDNCETVSREKADSIIDDLILSSIDVDKKSEELDILDLSERDRRKYVIDDYLENNFNAIGHVFDVNINTEKYVTDIENMYSSIVPNTVR